MVDEADGWIIGPSEQKLAKCSAAFGFAPEFMVVVAADDDDDDGEHLRLLSRQLSLGSRGHFRNQSSQEVCVMAASRADRQTDERTNERTIANRSGGGG